MDVPHLASLKTPAMAYDMSSYSIYSRCSAAFGPFHTTVGIHLRIALYLLSSEGSRNASVIVVTEIGSSSRPLLPPEIWPHTTRGYARLMHFTYRSLPVALEVQRSLPVVFWGAGWQVQRRFPDLCIPLERVLL